MKSSFFFFFQAKPYKNNPEILAMTNLVTAYQNDDITEFEKILRMNRFIYLKIPHYFKSISSGKAMWNNLHAKDITSELCQPLVFLGHSHFTDLQNID